MFFGVLRQVSRNGCCLPFFLPPCCLSLPLLVLKTSPFQVSLWNKTGSLYLQVIPAKSQHAPFLGHHMKGGMRRIGDACGCVFGFLCMLNVCVCVCGGGECVQVTPCKINLPTCSRLHLAGQRVPLCHMSGHLECVFRKGP